MVNPIDPTIFDHLDTKRKEEEDMERPESQANSENNQKEDDGGDSITMEDLDFFGDVPLKISAELGRIESKVKDVLSMGEGSVIELEKLAGEPLEILINGRLICRGEVIVINEKYGIRMTDIVSPQEKSEFSKKQRSGYTFS